MLLRWLFFLLVLLLGTELKAQEWQFDSTVIDYGLIKRGAPTKRLFTFTNTGDQPLILSQVKTTCACSASSYSKEPILPGEKGQIEVRYDSHYVGRFHKYIYVVSNARQKPVQKLEIKGRCVP